MIAPFGYLTLFSFGFFFFAAGDAFLEALAKIAPAAFLETPSLAAILFCTDLNDMAAPSGYLWFRRASISGCVNPAVRSFTSPDSTKASLAVSLLASAFCSTTRAACATTRSSFSA
jgi:hypothetical protein